MTDSMSAVEYNQQRADAMSEETLTEAIVECAQRLRWLTMHIPDRLYKLAATEERYDAMVGAKGYPDLTLVRDGKIIFAELKTEAGKLSDAQREWLSDLNYAEDQLDHYAVGADSIIEVYIWRPSQWLSGDIEAILRGGTESEAV